MATEIVLKTITGTEIFKYSTKLNTMSKTLKGTNTFKQIRSMYLGHKAYLEEIIKLND